MFWITLALGSALFLGLYDISKKKALTGNAVLPVLFLVSLVCAIVLSPAFFLGKIPNLTPSQHLMLVLKAGIVSTSWIFTFNAVSRLPLSITAPIRASAPVFTIFLAVSFMSERPSGWEWTGICISIASYLIMSIASRKETGHFFRNPWIISMFFGTFLGSVSGVYDKFLLQRMAFPPLAVQFYFNVYMVCIQGAAIAVIYFIHKRKTVPTKFEFRKIILIVGVLLVIADRFYFLALHDPNALVSVVTVIRRSNVLISFAGGLFFFKEKKTPLKFVAMAGILLGLACFAIRF
ncbi:MAG: DMT family transporter [Fibrobacteraceae bacterium]|nr:DMT family transporter [Fibrobacteraceae bacterium]